MGRFAGAPCAGLFSEDPACCVHAVDIRVLEVGNVVVTNEIETVPLFTFEQDIAKEVKRGIPVVVFADGPAVEVLREIGFTDLRSEHRETVGLPCDRKGIFAIGKEGEGGICPWLEELAIDEKDVG